MGVAGLPLLTALLLIGIGDLARGDIQCSPGWTPLHRACYRFVDLPTANWTEARESCQSEGAQLLVINDMAEYKGVTRQLKKEGKAKRWVGMHKVRGQWQWLDGTSLEFRITPWEPQEPNNEGGQENCVEMNFQGKLNDKECDGVRPYICECEKLEEDGNERGGGRPIKNATDNGGSDDADDNSNGKLDKDDKKRKEEDDDDDDFWERYAGCFLPDSGSGRNRKQRHFLYHSGDTSCPALNASRASWPETPKNRLQSLPCRKGQGNMTFLCDLDPVCWRGQPNVDQCASKAFRQLLNSMSEQLRGEEPEPEETLALTSELANVTRGDDVTEEDIAMTSKLIRGLVTPGSARKMSRDKKAIRGVVANVVSAGSNLVSRKRTALWSGMTRRDKVRSATSLLVAMETATVILAGELAEPISIVTRDENIELELRVVNVTSSAGEGGGSRSSLHYRAEDSDTQFSIPLAILTQLSHGELAKVVFMTHYTMGSLLDDVTDDDTQDVNDNQVVGGDENAPGEKKAGEGVAPPQLASHIVSASVVNSQNSSQLSQPVIFTIAHTKKIPPGFQTLCAFWNIDRNGLGAWSQTGCGQVSSNDTHTTCQCDRMANFAVLMAVKNVISEGLCDDSERDEDDSLEKEDRGPITGDMARGDNQCSPGWTPLHRACYRFVDLTSASWTEARERCQSAEAQLLAINDLAEYKRVKGQLKKEGQGKTWWVGLHKDGGQWQWLDGTSLEFRSTCWESGQPNNQEGQENCVEMKFQGKLNDKDCDGVRPYICEKLDEEVPESQLSSTLNEGATVYNYVIPIESIDTAPWETAPQPSTSQVSSSSQTPQPALPKRKKRRVEHPPLTFTEEPDEEKELTKLFLKSYIEKNKAQTEVALLQKQKLTLHPHANNTMCCNAKQ